MLYTELRYIYRCVRRPIPYLRTDMVVMNRTDGVTYRGFSVAITAFAWGSPLVKDYISNSITLYIVVKYITYPNWVFKSKGAGTWRKKENCNLAAS